MKKNKKLSEGLAEVLLELILMLIFFGIGAGIVALFGIDFNAPNVDHDLLILLGIVVFVLLVAGGSALIIGIKKFRRKHSAGEHKERISK